MRILQVAGMKRYDQGTNVKLIAATSIHVKGFLEPSWSN